MSIYKYQTKILYTENHRIGYIQIKDELDFIYISMIVLTPEYQSKGFGSYILNMLQESKPNTPLRLSCFQINKAAYRFYQRVGFKVLKTDRKFIYLHRASRA